MKKFKPYTLNENVVIDRTKEIDEAEYNKLLNNNCTQFNELNKKPIFYRNCDESINFNFAIIEPLKFFRIPSTTKISLHNYYINTHKDTQNRNKSVIFTNTLKSVKRYGDNIYQIIPYDNAKFSQVEGSQLYNKIPLKVDDFDKILIEFLNTLFKEPNDLFNIKNIDIRKYNFMIDTINLQARAYQSKDFTNRILEHYPKLSINKIHQSKIIFGDLLNILDKTYAFKHSINLDLFKDFESFDYIFKYVLDTYKYIKKGNIYDISNIKKEAEIQTESTCILKKIKINYV